MVPVYVNAQRIEIPAGATVLDAIRQWNCDAATEVGRGARAVTDSRGLPASLDAPVYGGAILRVSAPRASGAHEDVRQ